MTRAASPLSPEVFDAVSLDGRFGIVLQHRDGPTLLQLFHQLRAVTSSRSAAILATVLRIRSELRRLLRMSLASATIIRCPRRGPRKPRQSSGAFDSASLLPRLIACRPTTAVPYSTFHPGIEIVTALSSISD